jgi:hypothetical protein
MQRVNEFNFYDLAVQIHPLSEIGGSQVKYGEVFFQWFQAREAIDQMFLQRPLTVSLSAAKELYSAITEYVPEKWPDAIGRVGTADDKEMEGWEVAKISDAAKKFETVLAAECQVMDTYFVSKKGTYSTADLIEHAHYQIPEKMRKDVPDQTKLDFDQAGKCIAFDLPTAAAYHLLRGTESVIRKYYDQVVPGSKKAPAKARNWGVYIKLLRDHGAEEKVTSLLTHIKDSYRNPVLHPEDNYTEEMVQVLFGVCVSAIVMIVEELKKLANTPASLPFPPAVPKAFASASPTESALSFGEEAGMKIVI